MNTTTRTTRTMLGAVTAFAGLVISVPASAPAENTTTMSAGMAMGKGGMCCDDPAMAKMMGKMEGAMKSVPMSGNPDIDFAAMMIPHHEGAIAMAKAYLAKGKDEKLRRMAEAMIEGQTKEISEMKEVAGRKAEGMKM